MNYIDDILIAKQYITEGKVIAYPTEAVYGLGCLAFNEQAVARILALKKRSSFQGLILLIKEWEQLFPLIDFVPDEALKKVEQSWPGPVTFIFPKSSLIPSFISGEHKSVAIRMSAHPLVRNLCDEHPLVSTSANLHGHEPARDVLSLTNQFPTGIDGVVLGDLGGATSPSAIYDVLSGHRLR